MNAKDPEVIEQFITLRARGVPYAKIAAELSVSPRTLIVWSREFADRLSNEAAIPYPKLPGKAKTLVLTLSAHFKLHTCSLNSPMRNLKKMRNSLKSRCLK